MQQVSTQIERQIVNNEWQYQLRVELSERMAEVARRDPNSPLIEPLPIILRRHVAKLECQFDAFADYVADAEKYGVEKYPLYRWTKATIENPLKKEKYLKSFTLCIGGYEVYAKDKADALELDLRPLLGGGLITRMSKHDTNPANNPQPPARYQQ